MFGTAAAGVVIGHWISYRIAVPDHHSRDLLLAATGHDHWLTVVKIAVALALAGAVTLAARFASRTAPRTGADALTWAITRIAIVQVVAFTGMEAVERIAGGAPVAGMFAHHLFLLGLAVQLFVACAGGAFVYWLSRTARAIAQTVRSLPHLPAPPVAVVVPVPFVPVRTAVARRSGIRGPPPA